jgi:hypothetical protein
VQHVVVGLELLAAAGEVDQGLIAPTNPCILTP